MPTRYVIKGQILTTETGQSIPNLQIQAWNEDLTPNDPLGKATTDQDGKFTIRLSEAQHRELLGNAEPSTFFKVFYNRKLVLNTRNTIIYNPRSRESLRLEIPEREVGMQPTEPEESPQSFEVTGQVADPNGKAITRAYVRAYDKKIGEEKALGESKTDAEGNYKITYTADQLSEPDKERADLIVKVFKTRRASEPEVISPLLLNARDEEIVNLSVGEEAFRGEDDYTLLHRKMTAVLNGLRPEKVDDSELQYIIAKHQLDALAAHQYIMAHKLVARNKQLPAVLLYAWFQMGMATDENSLLMQVISDLQAGLTSAVERNIVPREVLKTKRLERIFLDWRTRFILTEAAEPLSENQSSFGALLKSSKLNGAEQKSFLESHQTFEGTADEFWEEQTEQLGKAKVNDVRLALQLGAFSRNHLPLIKSLKRSAGIKRFSDISRFNEKGWLTLLKSERIAIPEDIRGEKQADKRATFAKVLGEITDNLFPTLAFGRTLEEDSAIESTDFTTFFNNNPEFEFLNTTVASYLEVNSNAFRGIRDKEAFQPEIEALQRTFLLSPVVGRNRTAKLLWQNKLHTVGAIRMFGLDGLKEIIGDPGTANKVLYISNKVVHSTQIQSASIADASNTNLHVIATPKNGSANLAELFGSQDYCQCQHCRSFFSPSAYLTDLFLFLNRAVVKNPSGKALEKLFDRRPDLGNILLDCKNSHTLMPYIDLVNETLENAISPRNYEPLIIKKNDVTWFTVQVPVTNADAVPQTEIDEAQLKAFPEHSNPEAYEVLGSNGISYPWGLPYNFWWNQTNAYLNHIKVPRWEIMESVLGTGSNELDIAIEYLKLIPEEHALLVNASASNNKLKKDWGGKSVAVLTGDKNVVDILEKSGLSFAELETLLELPYIKASAPGEVLGIEFDPPESCELDDATLKNLTATGLSRIHRFVRFWRKTGLKMGELDRVIMAFGGEIDDSLLINLAFMLRLQNDLPRKIKLPEMLSWWGEIGTLDIGKYKSAYTLTFLNPTVNQKVADLFLLKQDGSALANENNIIDWTNETFDPDHIAMLQATLRLKGRDFKLLAQAEFGLNQFSITLANISHLYRIASFCKGMRISVSDYISLKALIPFPAVQNENNNATVTPHITWSFFQRVLRVQDSGLNIAEFDYLSRHQFQPKSGLSISDDRLNTLLTGVRNTIREQTSESDTSEISVIEALEIKLGLMIPVEEIEMALLLIKGKDNLTDEEKDTLMAMDSVATELFLTENNLVDNLIMEAEERYSYALVGIRKLILLNAVVQVISEGLELDTKLTEFLLKTYLDHPDPNETSKALSVFFDAAFIQLEEGEPLVSEFTDLTTFPLQVKTLQVLHKITLIVSRLELTEETVRFLAQSGTEFGLPNLSDLPTSAVETTLTEEASNAWDALFQLVLFDRNNTNEESSAYALLATLNELSTADLADATGWDAEVVSKVMGTDFMNISFPNELMDTTLLTSLADAMNIVAKTGSSPVHIQNWTSPNLGKDHADSVRNVVKVRYDNEGWLSVAETIHNELRESLRDALVSYVLNHTKKHDNQSFQDADELYSYFLIDHQTNACMLTSRTKLAISSCQLFVQRMMMNLEPGMSLSRNNAEQWKWRKYYRVWEANRKVFLWPENWVEPELRDDKTPLFKDLENDLLQNELNDSTVERAFSNYLFKLDEISRLDICGMYNETENGTVHVFGRTSGTPPAYYYRKREKNRQWTAWEKVELDIYNAEGVEEPQTGVTLIPVVRNRRLYLLWPVFKMKQGKPSEEDKKWISGNERVVKHWEKVHSKAMNEGLPQLAKNCLPRFLSWIGTLGYVNGGDKKDYPNAYVKAFIILFGDADRWENEVKPEVHQKMMELLSDIIDRYKAIIEFYQTRNSYYEITMAWSQYRDGNWKAKKSTSGVIKTPRFGDNVKEMKDISSYVFLYGDNLNDKGSNVRLTEAGNPIVSVQHIHRFESTGQIANMLRLKSRFIHDECRDELKAEQIPDEYWTKHGWYSGFGYHKLEEFERQDDRLTVEKNSGHKLLLNKTPGDYALSKSFQYGLTRIGPSFIYEDEKRSFFVEFPVFRINRHAIDPFADSVLKDMASNSFGRAMTVNLEDVNPETTVVNSTTIVNSGRLNTVFFGSTEENTIIDRGMVELSGNVNGAIMANTGAMSSIMDVSNAVMGLGSGRPSLVVNGEIRFHTFYHPHTCLFLKQLNRYGVEGLLNPNEDMEPVDGETLANQLTPKDLENFDFVKEYDPYKPMVDWRKPPREIIDFDYEGAYSVYNWELFFHAPLFIAGRLSQDQRFEEAQKWYHYIFNPTESEGEFPYRFWKIKPFHTYTLDEMEKDLTRFENMDKSLQNQVDDWEEKPFNPHLLARLRRLTYMRTVVMKYLDNLIAWGDQLFRRDSIESVNEASQLYVLAGQVLGKVPADSAAKATEVQSFNDLAQSITGVLSNPMVSIQDLSSEGAENLNSGTDIVGDIPYFCLPPNEKLLGYWDTVADRLFKIRNCMNIEGVVRQMSLFEPPIDPAILVRAVASGVDLSSAINDLYAPMPNYRFAFMVQQAQGLSNQLQSLSTSLLAALEKKDAEALAIIRGDQEVGLLRANREIRRKQMQEAESALTVLEESKALSEIKQAYYDDKDFMNVAEVASMVATHVASVADVVSVMLATGEAVATVAPDPSVLAHIQGMSSGTSTKIEAPGGTKAGKSISAASKVASIVAIIAKGVSQVNATMAGYLRREEEWDFQIDMTKQEIKQIDQQIIGAEIRIEMAEREADNLELQIDDAIHNTNYMRSKYTNEALYNWMITQISTVYFQTYQMAYDLAKQAEKAFVFELDIEQSNYIKFGYWNNMRKGLLAGDKLSADLKRLELAYYEKNKRKFEMTKHISLMQVDPIALLLLREKGVCDFSLPEELFDLDYPGHYFRKIKSVSISIPCIVGPYTSINCTLRLMKNRLRINTKDGTDENNKYKYTGSDDTRFMNNNIPFKSIAISSGQTDSGMFELNFRDERYLPFEGAGTISDWKLEFPADINLRQFDYNSISDVIMHVSYTSKEDNGPFKTSAIASLNESLSGENAQNKIRIFDLKHDFPTEWNRFATSDEAFKANIKKEHFPYFVQGKNLVFAKVELMLPSDLAAFASSDLMENDPNKLENIDSDAFNMANKVEFEVAHSVLNGKKEQDVFMVVYWGLEM